MALIPDLEMKKCISKLSFYSVNSVMILPAQVHSDLPFRRYRLASAANDLPSPLAIAVSGKNHPFTFMSSVTASSLIHRVCGFV